MKATQPRVNRDPATPWGQRRAKESCGLSKASCRAENAVQVTPLLAGYLREKMKSKRYYILLLLPLMFLIGCKGNPTNTPASTPSIGEPTDFPIATKTLAPTSTIPPTPIPTQTLAPTEDPNQNMIQTLNNTNPLRSCPNKSCDILATIKKGEVFEVLQFTENDWYQIQYGDIAGWMNSASAQPLGKITAVEVPDFGPTPVPPFDYHDIGMPLDEGDVTQIVANYGCYTSGTDGTHDGLDIIVGAGDIPVYAVGDGMLTYNKVNESTGFEAYLKLGTDQNGNSVYANYVHMDKMLLSGEVSKGDVIGYITASRKIGLSGRKILYFGIRIGDKVRHDTPNDGARGDEVDITDLLVAGWPNSSVKWDDNSCK